MHPILFSFRIYGRQLTIGSYNFFLILAAAGGIIIAWLMAKHRGLSSKQATILLLGVAVAVPLGARFLRIVADYSWYQHQSSQWFSFKAAGFALFGGLFLAALVGLVVCRLLRINLWHTADSITPALGISIAIVRVGCFLQGCCPGTSSSLPWAITFPPNSRLADQANLLPLTGTSLGKLLNSSVPTHPVMIYELIAALIGMIIALLLIKKRSPDGAAFLGFFLWFSVFRLANHPLRVPSSAFTWSPWFYPVLYILTFLLSAGLMIRIILLMKSNLAKEKTIKILR